ncbi:uncharacterized protein LOC121869393 [Homarus americanus]|nr:uncharacterized protein LOC121869393 [Homarus americanus]
MSYGPVLFLVACGGWMGVGLSAIVTSEGIYGVSDMYYENAIVHSSMRTEERLLETYYPTSGISVQQMLLMCHRRCIQHSNCHSFIFNASGNYCRLTTYDRCADSLPILYKKDGMKTFDVRPGHLPKPIRTCFTECLQGDCWICGRLHCQGEHCDDCAHNCWNEQLKNKTAYLLLWKTEALTLTSKYHCDRGWQKIWRFKKDESSITKSFMYDLLWVNPLSLRLRVVYDDFTVYSYFANFSYSSKIIGVGNFLGGDAGNYWQAPFENLNLKTTCPLFHSVDYNCTSDGDGLYSNLTWLTGNDTLDSKILTEVDIWVTAVGEEWYDQAYPWVV